MGLFIGINLILHGMHSTQNY